MVDEIAALQSCVDTLEGFQNRCLKAWNDCIAQAENPNFAPDVRLRAMDQAATIREHSRFFEELWVRHHPGAKKIPERWQSIIPKP